MDIIQLIEELEDVMDDANTIPFSKKVGVDPDEVFEIIKEIRASLPEEIRQAKWVNDERDRILSEANVQAQEVIKKAEKQFETSEKESMRRFDELVNQNQITKAANERGSEIIAEAERKAKDIKESVFRYVDEILKNTQDNLKSVVKELDDNRQELK